MRVIPYDRVYPGVYDNTYCGAARWIWLWLTRRLEETERLERRIAIRKFVRQQRELRDRTGRPPAGGTGGPSGPRRAQLRLVVD